MISATSAWVRRRAGGTSIRSTTSRSTTSSAMAWSISSSEQPRSRAGANAPGSASRAPPGQLRTAPLRHPPSRHVHPTGCVRPAARTGRRPGAAAETPPTLAQWLDPHGPRCRADPLQFGPRAVLIPVKSFVRAKRRLHRALERTPSGPSWPGPWPTGCSPRPVRYRSPWCATTPRWPNGPAGAAPWWCGNRAGASTARSRPESTICARPASSQVTVAHADLPRASTSPLSANGSGITLVPDRYGNGTNVMALPTERRLPVLVRPGLLRPPSGRGATARAPAAGARPSRPGLGHRRTCRRGSGGRPRCAPPGDTAGVGAKRGRRPGGAERASGRRPADRRSRSPPTCRPRPVALAIGAHPDDIEFGCGATLAKWAAAGCRGPLPGAHRRVQGQLGPGADPTTGRGACGRVPGGGSGHRGRRRGPVRRR